MLAFRSLSRAAPRALPRFPRATSSIFSRLPATRATAARVVFPRTSASLFSTSTLRAQSAGEVDAELSAKLESEIQFEEDVAKEEQLPATIKDFLANGQFEVVDIEGQEEVKLVRSHGDEKITVSFSVTELPYPEEDMMEDDQAFDDTESLENQSNAQDPASRNNARAAEEDLVDEDSEDYDGAAPPTHLTVVIEKPTKSPGALSIECTAQDGAIIIDNVHFYLDSKQAFASSPEASHARVDAYPGPSFSTLDEDLQVLIEQFIEERGISQNLAVFIPDYIDFKEQKEYQRWLKNVKGFVDL
jgi:complement component 1 Q subcomponent-binding protein